MLGIVKLYRGASALQVAPIVRPLARSVISPHARSISELVSRAVLSF